MAALAHSMQSPAASHAGDGPPSTAHVLDFVCLFTHDLRRKQKRWQDGRLKFHDFNKRIMVYDERGNFIGDTHWREDYEFGPDEEVTLERGGVIVQVQECVGSRDQDLSELIDKRVQEKAQRQSAAVARHARSTPAAPSPGTTQPATPHCQVRQTPLLNILGPPTGHHGRALIPTGSPFEQRQKQNAHQSAHQDESPHPAKRRRREPSPSSKSGYAQSLFGATLTLSGRPMSSAPMRRLPSSVRAPRPDLEPPPSSERSVSVVCDDDVLEVAPTPEPASKRSIPLSEQTVAAANAHSILPDVLVGKDARSKANVPSLLRHRRPTDDHATQNSARSINSGSRGVAKATDHEDSQPITKEIANLNGRAGKLPPNPDRTKQKQPLERTSREKPRKPSDKRILAGSDTTRRPSGEHESSESQACTGRPVIDLTELEATPKSPPAIQKPQIEIRMKSSKRRGLLMVSEKKNLKKARKSTTSSDTDGLDSPMGNNTTLGTTAAHRNNDHRFTPGERCSGSSGSRTNSVSKSVALEYSSSTASTNDVPFRTDTNHQDKKADIIKVAERAGSSLPSQDRTRRPSPARRRATLEGPDTQPPVISSEELDRVSQSPPPYSSRNKAGTKEDAVSPSTSCESAAPRAQAQTRRKRKSRSASPEYGEDGQPAAVSMSNIEKSGIAASSKRKKGNEQGFPGKRPEKAPPPRLAPLARRSIRSKEVIGFFPDSDEESFTEVEINRSRPPQSLTRGDPMPSRKPILSGLRSTNQETSSFSDEHGSTIPQSHQGVMRDSDLVISSPADANGSRVRHEQPKSASLAPAVSTSDVVTHGDSQNHQGKDTVTQPPTPLAAAGPYPPREKLVVSEQAPRGADTNTSGPDSLGTAAKEPDTGSTGRQAGRHDLQERHASWDCSKPVQSHVLQNDVHEDISVKKGIDQKPVPKLSNPATRGRKAARPSDAAGQVPESILPSDGMSGMARQVGRPPPKVTERASRQTATNLPGFSKANGGPWSREAHDLFEYRRPD